MGKRIFKTCCPGSPIVETGIEGLEDERVVTTIFADNENNIILFTNRRPNEIGLYDSNDINIICSRCGRTIELE